MDKKRLSVHLTSPGAEEQRSAARAQVDQDGNVLPYCQEALKVKAEALDVNEAAASNVAAAPLAAELIGPEVITLKGGMAGVYIRSTGHTGEVSVTISNPQLGKKDITFRCV